MINFPFSRFVGQKIIGIIGDISISRPVGYRIMFKIAIGNIDTGYMILGLFLITNLV